MPIKLITDSRYPDSGTVLEIVSFINNEEGNYFILTDKGNEIRVDYIPTYVSTWDPQRYDIVLFENPYLTAENDIFEVYESTIEGRFGWIFPIAALDSNENDFANHPSFRNYRYVAYWKLLQLDFQIEHLETKSEYRLSDIFPNLFAFIISKEEKAKIPNFRIEDYALSLFRYDFLIFNKSVKGTKVFDKDDSIEKLRKGNHSLKIRKSSFDISNNQYTKSLFLEHLYQSESFLVKYISLYQILEHFIEENADKQLEELIQSYQEGKITKNALRERLGKISSDRTLLKKAFEKSEISKQVRVEFIEKCSFLFADIGDEVSQNFEDAVYDLRNLITHRYRTISDRTQDLKVITALFEAIMIDLLINFNIKEQKEEDTNEFQPKIKTTKSTHQDNKTQQRRDVFLLQIRKYGISFFILDHRL